MRIKAVQIARELGISKATVSLALNNKPGVSEQTRQEIFACKERLEREKVQELGKKAEISGRDARVKDRNPEEKTGQGMTADRGTVKVIVASKGVRIAFASEMDLWTDVLAVFEKESKKRGYRLGVIYVDVRTDDIEAVVEECSGEDTAGVILQATELADSDIARFEQIKTPMVIYDNESTDAHHNCVVADNRLGVERAVRYLFEQGHHDIRYLANDQEIYNFTMRRKGFCDAFLSYNRNPYQEGTMIQSGTTIESVYQRMHRYLKEHGLPDAFVMENYQVTVGVVRALKEHQIRVSEQVSLIGVDVLPAYMTGDCQITAVRIPHTERAVLTMMMLEKEIEEQSKIKSRIMTDCPLVCGESVKELDEKFK